jgi:hypothetical protein
MLLQSHIAPDAFDSDARRLRSCRSSETCTHWISSPATRSPRLGYLDIGIVRGEEDKDSVDTTNRCCRFAELEVGWHQTSRTLRPRTRSANMKDIAHLYARSYLDPALQPRIGRPKIPESALEQDCDYYCPVNARPLKRISPDRRSPES